MTERETGRPIRQATLRFAGSDAVGITDSAGRFFIATDQIGAVRLRVTCLGYESVEKLVILTPGDTVHIRIEMRSALTEIRGVQVSGNRHTSSAHDGPQPVSLITSEQFSEQSFSSTAELLREEPGVLVQKTTHGHGSPVIRGLIGKYVLLLYDGIRLNRPTFRFGANQYMNSFDQNWLASVAVTRGPASVLYGSDAMGGAVNMVSYSPGFAADKARYETRAGFKYSSIDQGFTFNSRFSATEKNLSAWAGLTYKQIGDLTAGGDIGRQSPTGWDEMNFIAQTNYLFDQNQIGLQYLTTKQSEVPRYDRYVSGAFEKYVYDPQDRQMVILSLQNLEGEGRKTASRISLSYSREDEGQTEQKTGADRVLYSRQRVTTWGGFGQMSFVPKPDHRLTFGAEYYADKVTGSRIAVIASDTTIERPAYPNGSIYHSFGLYTEFVWPASPNWEITSGLRFSRISLRTNLEPDFGNQDELFSNLTGAVSAIYFLSDELNFLTRWSRGFRAPNLNDVANLGTSSSGFDIPSPGLSPETSDDFEIGVRLNSNELSGAAYIFYSRLHDLIDRRPGIYQGLPFFDDNGDGLRDANELDVFQKKNVGEAEIYGLELDADWQISKTLKLKSNLFYTRGENITDNEPLSRIPPLMGKLSIRKIFSENRWVEFLARSATDQRRLSQRDIDDTRIEPGGTDGWGTLNLRASTVWHTTRITVALYNLTDRAYKEHGSGVYSPGRGFNLSVSYAN